MLKVCLSDRHSIEYLNSHADEIRVPYRDKDYIPDLMYKTKAAIVFELPRGVDIDFDQIKKYVDIYKDRIIFCLFNTVLIDSLNAIGAKWFINFAVESFMDLQALAKLEPACVFLGPELFFNLPTVKDIGVPIRVVPNVATTSYLSTDSDGVHGLWVRPEDLEEYANYIDAIEFVSSDLTQEQALYRIYIEDKAWPGELSDLIKNFHYPALNRMIDPQLSRRRINCGQRCEKAKDACHLCYLMCDLANKELMSNIKKKEG